MTSSPAEPIPLAILGGSSAFLPSLVEALADRATDLPSLDVRLLGRDPQRTGWVADFCSRYTAAREVPHTYRAVDTVETAAEGAGVVLNQVRIGGFRGRSADARLALQFDCPGDETIGPSGLAAAFRCLPPIVELARRVERVAPDAWFVQSSNPMSMLLHGVREHTGLRTFGLCELPTCTLAQALDLVDQSPQGVDYDYVGVNHQGWFTRIEHGGVDLIPEIIDQAEDGTFRVDAAVMRDRSAVPLPYNRLYEHRQREVEAERARGRERGDQLQELADQLFAHYRDTDHHDLPPALARRRMPWNALTIVPAITALLGGPRAEVYVSTRNDGHLDFLPDSAVIEASMTVGANGPEEPDALARDIKTSHPWLIERLQRIAEFETLGARAAWTGSADLATAALAAHPYDLSAAATREFAQQLASARSQSSRSDP